jgi:hypothetical protein
MHRANYHFTHSKKLKKNPDNTTILPLGTLKDLNLRKFTLFLKLASRLSTYSLRLKISAHITSWGSQNIFNFDLEYKTLVSIFESQNKFIRKIYSLLNLTMLFTHHR